MPDANLKISRAVAEYSSSRTTVFLLLRQMFQIIDCGEIKLPDFLPGAGESWIVEYHSGPRYLLVGVEFPAEDEHEANVDSQILLRLNSIEHPPADPKPHRIARAVFAQRGALFGKKFREMSDRFIFKLQARGLLKHRVLFVADLQHDSLMVCNGPVEIFSGRLSFHDLQRLHREI
ncbi:MAG: hypothetical protein ABI876_16405, partial [Bacteroidota bacterium]